MPAVTLLRRQFLIEWKLYARDRHSMFWTFLFPLVMLFGLGTIFRGGGGAELTVVRIGGEPASEAEAALDRALGEHRLQVLRLAPAAAELRWRKGETVIEVRPDAAGFALRLNGYHLAQASLAQGLVNQAWLVAQARLAGRPEPARIPARIETPGHATAGNYAAFLLPGLIGLNLLSMGIFAVGMVNVAYREKGKFRRLAVTPLPRWIFLGGQILHRLTVVGLQTLLVLLTGWLGFGITNQGSYLALAVLLVAGTATFMALGFALSAMAETTESYAGLANLFFFSMMFLSGVYFTLDTAPRWLQAAVQVLPLSPFLRALRAVFNDGAALSGHLLGLLVVGLWFAAAFALALRRFRWA